VFRADESWGFARVRVRRARSPLEGWRDARFSCHPSHNAKCIPRVVERNRSSKRRCQPAHTRGVLYVVRPPLFRPCFNSCRIVASSTE
jgi:hypothetical protein